MISLLQQIACVLLSIPCFIIYALVGALNLVIAALALFASGLFAVMPGMPAIPSMPGPMTTALSWVAWAFPVGTVVDIFAFVLVAWLAWQGVAIGLRWAKATSE